MSPLFDHQDRMVEFVDFMIASIPSFHEGCVWRITPRLNYKTRLNRFISRTKPRASSFHSLFPEDEEIRQDHCLYIISDAGVLHIPSHKTKSEMRRSLSDRVLRKIQLPNVEEQGICMAGTFSVAASNGIDIKRKVHFQVTIIIIINLTLSLTPKV